MKQERETAFDAAMLALYDVGVKNKYNATRFQQMLRQNGGVETAHRLLHPQEHQQGLTRLWELGLLDHSVEALVLRDEFAALFTDEERGEARRRLAEIGYFNKS